MPQELRSRRNRVVVECRKVEASAVARPEIFISPLHADSVGVGAVLVHELIHAATRTLVTGACLDGLLSRSGSLGG